MNERTEIKVGAAYRIFDRKSIEKVCRLLNFIVEVITEELKILSHAIS